MSDRITVIGGTGLLGRPVAEKLADQGWSVRVTSRDPGRVRDDLDERIEVVEADVEDGPSLDAALDGAFGAHISVSPGNDPGLERRGVGSIVRSAVEQGLSRIGLVSGASTNEANAWFPFTRSKLDAEAAVKASGIPWTIFRPTWVTDMLPKFAQGKDALVFGNQPERIRFVTADDVARMVATAWSLPDAVGKDFPIYGPEPLTFEEALTIYCRVAKPGARVRHVPFWLMRVIGTLKRHTLLTRFVIPFMRYCEQVEIEPGDPDEANELLGEPTTTVEDWSRRQVP